MFVSAVCTNPPAGTHLCLSQYCTHAETGLQNSNSQTDKRLIPDSVSSGSEFGQSVTIVLRSAGFANPGIMDTIAFTSSSATSSSSSSSLTVLPLQSDNESPPCPIPRAARLGNGALLQGTLGLGCQCSDEAPSTVLQGLHLRDHTSRNEQPNELVTTPTQGTEAKAKAFGDKIAAREATRRKKTTKARRPKSQKPDASLGKIQRMSRQQLQHSGRNMDITFGEASESRNPANRDQTVAAGDSGSPGSSDSGRTITAASFSAASFSADPGSTGGSLTLEWTNTQSTTRATTTDSRVGERPSSGHPPPFKFDGLDTRLKCPLPECHKMTSCWGEYPASIGNGVIGLTLSILDPLVVICPACGTDNFTRYCKKQHLYEDIVRHWLEDCGKLSITGPIDRSTVRHSQIPRSAYVTGHFVNYIERHRQAVYRAMEDADYFLFNDADLVESETPTKEEWNLVRGRGDVRLAIKFPDAAPRYGEFDHHLMQCLKFSGPMALHNCDMAMHLIRETLILQGGWTEDILTDLCMQVAYEWNGYKVPEYFYNTERANTIYHAFGVLPTPPAFRQD